MGGFVSETIMRSGPSSQSNRSPSTCRHSMDPLDFGFCRNDGIGYPGCGPLSGEC